MRWLIGILLSLVILGGGAVLISWMDRRRDEPPLVADRKDEQPSPHAARLSPEQSREAIAQKNLGVAYLENNRLLEAAESLRELREMVPAELLPIQNLAVCYLLAAEGFNNAPAEDPAASQVTARRLFSNGQEAQAAAISAVERLIEQQPRSPVGYSLAARLRSRGLAADDQRAEVIHLLERAIERDPESVIYRYQLFDIARYASGPELQARGRRALKEAFDREPGNLALLRLLLETQLEQRDPEIVRTLQTAKELTRPFEQQWNLAVMIDNGLAAVEAGDWNRARQLARLGLVLRPLSTEDFDRLSPHPLAFVLHDFSEAYYQRHPPAPLPDPPAIQVSFETLGQQLPDPTGIRDLYLADMDLDELIDAVVLRDGRVTIYRRGDVASDWSLYADFDVPHGTSRILAIDLFMVQQPQAPKRLKPVEPNEAGQSSGLIAEGLEHNVYLGIIVYGQDGVHIYRRSLEGEQPSYQLVEQIEAIRQTTGVLALLPIDANHDGDLDLVLSTNQGMRVWTNRGDATFQDDTQWSTLPPNDPRITAMVPVDWDRNVRLDLLAGGSDTAASGILENVGYGRFRWHPFTRVMAQLAPAADLVVIEADGNASWDLASVSANGLKLVLTTTPQAGQVHPRPVETLSDQPWKGVLEWDYDNDAYRDLLAWNDDCWQLLRGQGEGAFEIGEAVLPDPVGSIRRIDTGDLDNDGDTDLAVLTDDQVVFYVNEGGNQNHWLDLRIRGRDDSAVGRVNHYGIGSLAEVKTGPRYQAQTVQRAITHFGLGQQPRADVARLLLTHGIPQSVIRPDANQVIHELMVQQSSCPYVYTWTGERFELFTDLLWAAPLGLQLAEGELAPSRCWEYLKISGDRMKLKDGQYHLQFTEELREAGYFDHVQLIAVDHGPDNEIYSNEKVGPAEISQFYVHTVRSPRRPVAARDATGADVLPQLRHADGHYLQGWKKVYCQGRVEEHYLELDLGELNRPRTVRLFLTGWLYPTDSSLNVALSQHPRLDGPRPPSVWVPDEQGQWQQTIAYMGFPGGKPKTICVDLSQAFLTDDYRVRIVTTAELYWDEVFFTVDDEPAEVQLKNAPLASADLHYRGFSELLPRQADEPHWFDYDRVRREPQWPPMQGNFTRYGDVRPLLTDPDDLMVVMGPGDEMTLVFDPPAEDPPAGWKRDFLLYNVGWDKDAVLNTIYGQTVEPLPFAAMQSYPYEPEQSYPQTPRHQAYLEHFQTRTQSWSAFWRQLAAERSEVEGR